MSRMTILSSAERQTFETPPVFDDAQRRSAFDLPDGLFQLVRQVRKPALQIGFILSCAYFSAAKRFFSAKDFRDSDIHFAAVRCRHRGDFDDLISTGSCLGDDGRPIGIGFQRLVSNRPRRLWSRAMVVSAGVKCAGLPVQVCVRKTSESKPFDDASLCTNVVKTRDVLIHWDKLTGHLITG